MPSPMANKRRRLSEDAKASPAAADPATTAPTADSPTRRPSLMRNYMTPTKASIAKSYPHLAKPLTPSRQQQHQQQPSPTRRHRHFPSPLRHSPRRSIPRADAEITQAVGARSFLDIANAPEDDHDAAVGEKEGPQGPTGMAMSVGGATFVKEKGKSLVETHLSSEEEIERSRGALMRRIRLLRAECEDLEGQLEQARHARQTAVEAQDKAVQTNLPATIQFLLQSNDTSLSRQLTTTTETLSQSLPTAAPKNLKNPLPLLRFIHPLTFYSTTSQLVPVDIHVLRQYELKGRTMERELYFTITMSVNESQERITALQIQTSPWAYLELSPLLQRVATTFNAQMALTALSTYGKVSSHRALVFARLAGDLIDFLSPTHSSTMQIVSRKGKERASDASLPIHRAKKLWLGERSISFHRGAVGIVIIWDIVLDDLGFAGSKLSLASSLPQNWRDLDERGVLDGLEGTFDSLVRRFGVERAVKTLVGVIYEDE